jgi:hypothetical protein
MPLPSLRHAHPAILRGRPRSPPRPTPRAYAVGDLCPGLPAASGQSPRAPPAAAGRGAVRVPPADPAAGPVARVGPRVGPAVGRRGRCGGRLPFRHQPQLGPSADGALGGAGAGSRTGPAGGDLHAAATPAVPAVLLRHREPPAAARPAAGRRRGAARAHRRPDRVRRRTRDLGPSRLGGPTSPRPCAATPPRSTASSTALTSTLSVVSDLEPPVPALANHGIGPSEIRVRPDRDDGRRACPGPLCRGGRTRLPPVRLPPPRRQDIAGVGRRLLFGHLGRERHPHPCHSILTRRASSVSDRPAAVAGPICPAMGAARGSPRGGLQPDFGPGLRPQAASRISPAGVRPLRGYPRRPRNHALPTGEAEPSRAPDRVSSILKSGR